MIEARSTTAADMRPGQRRATFGDDPASAALAHVRDLAREHTDEAIETLLGVMHDNDAPPAARVTAAVAILDRAWGRPAQMVLSARLGARSAHEYSEDELLAIVEQGRQDAFATSP
jgi:hypothetical protein